MHIDFQITGPLFTQCFSTEFIGAETLTDGEKVFIARAVQQRVNHFSTGRYCAKQALKALGINGAEILVGEGKEPLWPEGIVGSISHTKTMAGAVVARADKLVSIGMDIETIGGVRPDMWDMLFLPSEQQYLNAFTGDEQAMQTTLLFSGKEAFYKLQYPLTKTFLDFTDVEMRPANGKFELKVIGDMGTKVLWPPTTTIHYVMVDDQVITLCYQER
jgi:4'-phosphopantetheinyl transferase EntD